MHMEIIPGLPNDVGVECLIRVPYPYQHLSYVASVCNGWKHEIALPEFRTRRKAAGLTRKVVVMAQARVDSTRIGINNFTVAPIYRLTVCEPETGYWAELPTIPVYSDGLPMFCQLVGVGLDLVVSGGWNPVTWKVLNGVFIFNFLTATWRRVPNMRGCQRSFFACASDSQRMVFVAGGHDVEMCALKSAMSYDVMANEWVILPDMIRDRDEPKGIFLRGKFHVVGGYNMNMQGRFVACAEAFDVATWQWLSVLEGSLNSATCPINCIGDGNESLYMSYGADVTLLQESTWEVVCQLPSNVHNKTFVTAWQDKLLVIGTEGLGGPHQAYLLDLKSLKWEIVEVEEEFSGRVQSGCFLEL